MSQLPSGTVTFLFSDIEGSTRLLQQLGDAWGEALAEHRRLLRAAFEAAGGREVDTQGDASFVVFARARDAVTGAADGQRALAGHAWPGDIELRVRMGVHTGEPSVGEEGYLGLDVVRAARICSAAHGGQVLISETTRALVGGDDFRDLGLHRLKDLDGEQHLYQLLAPGLEPEFPPPRTLDAETGAPPLPFDVTGQEQEYARRGEEMTARIRAQVADSLVRELPSVVPNFDLDVLGDLKDAVPGVPPTQRRSRLDRLLRRRRPSK